MAKKAGKSKKAAVRKPAPSKHTTSRKAAPKPAAPAPNKYPMNVMVLKGDERLPVTVTDEVHHKRLVEEHGESCVVVQP